jgi:hypothetical protein
MQDLPKCSFLIVYDKEGVGYTPDGFKMSEHVKNALQATSLPFTDVFIISHGWKGDIPSARDQYKPWIEVVEASTDQERARNTVGGFRPLIISLHLPSLPGGGRVGRESSGQLGPAV